MKEVILQLKDFIEYLKTDTPAYEQILLLAKQDKLIKSKQKLVKGSNG